MDSELTSHDIFLLKHRPYCEMPNESGLALCMRRSQKIITIGRRSRIKIAVCDWCADYAEKEQMIQRSKNNGTPG